MPRVDSAGKMNVDIPQEHYNEYIRIHDILRDAWYNDPSEYEEIVTPFLIRASWEVLGYLKDTATDSSARRRVIDRILIDKVLMDEHNG